MPQKQIISKSSRKKMVSQALLLSPFPVHSHPGYSRRQIPLISGSIVSCKGWKLNANCRKNLVPAVSCSNGQQSFDNQYQKKRKVVEHLCLLKAKKDLSDEEEKDMLDYLYTTQYYMRGIIAVSLGRLSDQNVENYSHAVFLRFQRREDLEKFYQSSFYSGVLKEHVTPYCHGLTDVDFESGVEDDILPIFRKGEEYNSGVEFILLISFIESAIDGPAKDALASLQGLAEEHQSLIVQCTQGSNFNPSSDEYTHVVLMRFRSLDAFEIFINGSGYKNVWSSKFQPITKRTLALNFSVEPVGTEIM